MGERHSLLELPGAGEPRPRGGLRAALREALGDRVGVFAFQHAMAFRECNERAWCPEGTRSRSSQHHAVTMRARENPPPRAARNVMGALSASRKQRRPTATST
eukprot:4962291-Pyramimonas_sp.AAC.1